MKLLLGVVGALVTLLLVLGSVAVLVGRRLPERHDVTITRELPASLARVASRVREVASQPSWRSGITRIDMVHRDGDTLRYREHSRHGAIPYVMREITPDREFASVIDTDTLPFGGTWTYTLTALPGDHTRLAIREEGVVRSPVFRFVSRYVMGHTRTIEGYLNDLERAVRTEQGTGSSP